MEIRTSSLLAVGQGFSPNVARNDVSEVKKEQNTVQSSDRSGSEIVDQVDISPDVARAAKETSEIQSQKSPITESPEVVSQLEAASINVEAILAESSTKSADVATKILGNSADITV